MQITQHIENTFVAPYVDCGGVNFKQQCSQKIVRKPEWNGT